MPSVARLREARTYSRPNSAVSRASAGRMRAPHASGAQRLKHVRLGHRNESNLCPPLSGHHVQQRHTVCRATRPATEPVTPDPQKPRCVGHVEQPNIKPRVTQSSHLLSFILARRRHLDPAGAPPSTKNPGKAVKQPLAR